MVMNVKKYRPMFARMPAEGATMSQSEKLALEVNEFSVLGAFDENAYGSPQQVESVESLREWAEGMRAGGGGGYVPLDKHELTF